MFAICEQVKRQIEFDIPRMWDKKLSRVGIVG